MRPLSGARAQLEMLMKRGDVFWVNFEPSIGGEIQKKRPAVIVSNDAANRYMNRIQVIPLTTSVDRLYPCEAYIKLKNKQHKAMADQITTVSKSRLMNKLAHLTQTDMQSIENAIRIQLDLN